MTFRAQIEAESERLGELVRACEYLRQKSDLYATAVENYDAAAKMVADGARAEHLTSMKRQLDHAAVMLAGALDDAKDTMRRAQLMTPALPRTNEAAESGRSLTQ